MKEEVGDFIKCPACGYVDNDSWEFGSESGETNCEDCEIELEVEVYISVAYTTTIKGDDEE